MNADIRQVAMLDLHAEYRLFRDAVRTAVDAVLESQQFINGPAVVELEQALARRLGVAHAVAVSSGTDAILVALMALDIGPGNEVIVPSFTFFATAGCVARVGAKPVFADIDPRTFNLEPQSVEAVITPRTRAVIPVHLFGQCADMEPLRAIARRHGLTVIEDAAQAIGATYQTRPACSLGDMACLSFYPTKNLGGFGEGGMVLTSDDSLAQTIRRLRVHGESQRYIHERIGGNFRLDTMKAAILLVKLAQLDEFTRRRQTNAACYDALLRQANVVTPYVAPDRTHVYHQYTILSDRRDELAAFLKARGIATGIYYPVPLHRQRCFAELGYKAGALPMTESASARVLSLPCHPMLEEQDITYVAECITEFDRS